MSSLPPRTAGTQNRSSAHIFNRFARRDPQLYPLAAIMVGVMAVGGYFLTHKSQNHDAAKSLGQITNVWEGPNSQAGEKVKEWKYRFSQNSGIMEGEHPGAMNSKSVELKNVPLELRNKYGGHHQ